MATGTDQFGGARRLRAALLTCTALAGMTLSGAALSILASTPAQAAQPGGIGGAGGSGVTGGGDGGAGGTHGNGSDGQPSSGGDAGGLGGTSAGVDGTAGGAGGGGGGGGASGADISVGTLNNTGAITGGKGGNGGAGGLSGGGGGGGGGGGELIVTGTGAISNSGIITGGVGGDGGTGGNGGNGGDGGNGLAFTVGGVIFTNSGSVTGGNGGSGSAGGSGGLGGSGILAGADITIVNSGSIAGGSSGQGDAISAFGNVSVSNTGTIVSTSGYGVFGNTGATVTNAATGLIQGGFAGIYANSGSVNVTNDGAIVTTPGGGPMAIGGSYTVDIMTVINHAGDGVTSGIIRGDSSGIYSYSPLTVTNSGAIVGTTDRGISGGADITVTNNAGNGITTGIISGGQYGIFSFGSLSTVAVTNAGTITGGSVGIQANGAANISNTGIISGGDYGVVTGGGSSSVFNAGTITGGIAAIQFSGTGNTLTLGTGSTINGLVLGTGSDTLQLGGTGAATFDISQLSSTGQYQGFDTFNKIDNSVWTLTGTSTYAGGVNVNGGRLVVNGDLSSAGSMLVNPGGTLSGTGIVPFTLLANGATLAPGPVNGTGTLTINDRVMFCDCSTYALKVSATGNDRANIVAGGLGTGDAFLGGLVRVTSPTASYRFNSAYTILSTQGGLNGTTFDSLVTPTAIGGALSYTTDDVLLTLTSQLGQVAGLNANQQRLATRLDTAFNTLGNSSGLGGLFNGNIAQNLTQASGEIATGSQQTTFTAMRSFMIMMTDPFTAGRGFDAPGAPSYAYANASTAKTGAARDAYAMFTKAPLARTYDPRWNVWAAGFGGSQTTDGNAAAGSNTSRSTLGGVAAGADYLLSPTTVAGFALAGGGTGFSVAGGGSGRSDLFQAGAFVRHTIGTAYVTASAAYGWQDVTTDRIVTIAGADRLRAEFNANSFSARIEAGNRYLMSWLGGVGVTPYAAAQVTNFDLPAYAERAISGNGTFALAYAANSITATRSELGLRTDKSYALEGAVLILRGRAAWAHDFNPNSAVTATFQTLPGASFVVNGAALAFDSALTTASAEVRWMNGWSVAATFEGEFSDVTRSYAGKGVVRYNW